MTRDDIESAPMFAIFRGARPGKLKPSGRLPAEGYAWAIFASGPPHSDDVLAELAARRLILAGEELCDGPQRIDDAPVDDDYDDIEAAIAAIAAGFTLCKVPDVLGEDDYRMLVLDAWHEDGWYAIDLRALEQILAIGKERDA